MTVYIMFCVHRFILYRQPILFFIYIFTFIVNGVNHTMRDDYNESQKNYEPPFWRTRFSGVKEYHFEQQSYYFFYLSIKLYICSFIYVDEFIMIKTICFCSCVYYMTNPQIDYIIILFNISISY